ncbi:MAG: TetR family transcriptional regulator C-terminal domain-containing protein [Lachnospiraceae bacterium]|nr:TetR family transcriptional regulator C-terminal domain-containing protein [Ruminococcus sp.]MCM1276638.1 TetR family transcriptional regulator C-terminal domain-containing protein [Lachnospiraceae bacterium]
MSKNAKTTDFLKECMADVLLKLMDEKDFRKITINEIAEGANVNRSTWFRNYTAKTDALTFKLIRLWERWADDHNLAERRYFTTDNAVSFFEFNLSIRETLKTIYNAGLQSTIYDAFYQVMTLPKEDNFLDSYKGRFYSYGLFGLLDEWVKRDFCETTEEMAEVIYRIMDFEKDLH